MELKLFLILILVKIKINDRNIKDYDVWKELENSLVKSLL